MHGLAAATQLGPSPVITMTPAEETRGSQKYKASVEAMGVQAQSGETGKRILPTRSYISPSFRHEI